MSTQGLRLLHIAPHAHGYGGIETLLARHATYEPANGFDSWQLGLFEKSTAAGGERYSPQRFSWRETPRRMRRAMSSAMVEREGSVVIWHNAWGLPWFADLDHSMRRIVVMHANPSYFAGWLPKIRRWIDGVLTVSKAGADAVKALLPGWADHRVAYLPLPIEPPREVDLGRPLCRPWLIGCAGRLARTQKRWERLVPFVAELARLGVNFRLEIVGRGPLQQRLAARWRDDSRIAVLGFLEKPEFWRTMQQWDGAVFFSDTEGGPLVLLEAMAVGVVPFYPAIGGSAGDDYVPRIDPRCHYPAADPVSAARRICDVLNSPAGKIRELRARAHALVLPHCDGGYESTFAGFVRHIAALPRISVPSRADRRSRWTDLLPLGLVTRAFPRSLWQ